MTLDAKFGVSQQLLESELTDAEGILDCLVSLCSKPSRAEQVRRSCRTDSEVFQRTFSCARKVYESGAHERCVVAEFDSVDKAIAAYESPAYQTALALLKDACVREVRIVPGAGG